MTVVSSLVSVNLYSWSVYAQYSGDVGGWCCGYRTCCWSEHRWEMRRRVQSLQHMCDMCGRMSEWNRVVVRMSTKCSVTKGYICDCNDWVLDLVRMVCSAMFRCDRIKSTYVNGTGKSGEWNLMQFPSVLYSWYCIPAIQYGRKAVLSIRYQRLEQSMLVYCDNKTQKSSLSRLRV